MNKRRDQSFSFFEQVKICPLNFRVIKKEKQEQHSNNNQTFICFVLLFEKFLFNFGRKKEAG
jgi:hypothetical protein